MNGRAADGSLPWISSPTPSAPRICWGRSSGSTEDVGMIVMGGVESVFGVVLVYPQNYGHVAPLPPGQGAADMAGPLVRASALLDERFGPYSASPGIHETLPPLSRVGWKPLNASCVQSKHQRPYSPPFTTRRGREGSLQLASTSTCGLTPRSLPRRTLPPDPEEETT